jgi:hypothetical protein
MKKQALGLNDMRIPGLPNPSEKGLEQSDLEGYARFFGGLEEDPGNENSQPKVSRTDNGSKEDQKANEFFKFLQQKISKKKK